MIWSVNALKYKVELVVFQNIGLYRGHIVTALRYIEQVFRPQVLPILCGIQITQFIKTTPTHSHSQVNGVLEQLRDIASVCS